MNLNKEFLSEVISYLINKGVTLTDVLDTFNEHFNTHESFNNDIKHEYTEKQHEVRKPITDIDLLLCGHEIEKQGFNVELEPKYTLTESGRLNIESVSLSPEMLNKVFDTSKENPLPCRKLKSKSGQMLFDVINGKTVIEHLKENGITYTNFDNRIRKNWSVEKACTTPLTKVVKPYTRAKKPTEPPKQELVIIPDTVVKCLEPEKITGTKKRMMLVNGVMTEIDVSDTDLIQSDIVKPAENTTESVTNATALNGNNVTAVILDTPNPDAIRKDKNDIIEKALKKFVTHSEESKNDKKPKEAKKDYTVTDVCFKLNITTHELREKIENGEFPQPDCDKKWSVKLLKKEGII